MQAITLGGRKLLCLCSGISVVAIFVMFKTRTATAREFLTRDKSRAVSALNSFKNVPRVFHLNRIAK